jgi:hypothetical protein
MRPTILMSTVSILLACLIFGCGRSAGDISRESRAAAALFGEYETVFYARRDLSSRAGAFGQLSERNAEDVRTPFLYFLASFYWMGQQVPAEILSNSAAVLMGAKDFQPPKGLGPVHSQRCYVVVLGKWSTLDIRKYFNYAPVASAGGAPVWNWGANLGEFGEEDTRPSSLYAAVIMNSYLLVSNNLGELQSVADKLTSPKDDSPQTLSTIRDWEFLSRQKLWGYRRYRHAALVFGDASGMREVTPSAEALVFYFDSKKQSCALRVLASDGSTADKINSWGVFPPLQTSTAGTWETTIPLSNNEQTSDRVFYVFGLFGFGVFL